MKVGVQLPEVEREVRWPEVLDMARAAEDVGFDSLWLGDHLLYRDEGGSSGPWECWSQLAALAAVTTRVELGPLVASVSFHNPAMLAKKAATIDEISDGRLILGLGAGWNEAEYRAYGFPFDHRVDRFEEAIAIILGLLREGRVDFEGRYHRAEDCELLPRGPRPEGPPIMFGTMGPRMLELTARHADAWNAWFKWFDNTPDRLPPVMETMDRACEAAGRDPATLERTVAVLVQIGDGPVDRRNGGVEPLRGSPEQLAVELQRYGAAGIGHVQLVVDPITIESIVALGPALDALHRAGG